MNCHEWVCLEMRDTPSISASLNRKNHRLPVPVTHLFILFTSKWLNIPTEKQDNRQTSSMNIPIGSMYGIYANIGGILMVNVTIYSIHGSYGIGKCHPFRKTHPPASTASVSNIHFSKCLPSGNLTVCELENGPVEIVSFPIENGGSFHSFW